MGKLMSLDSFSRELLIRYEALLYEFIPLQARIENINTQMDQLWALMELAGVSPKDNSNVYLYSTDPSQELSH